MLLKPAWHEVKQILRLAFLECHASLKELCGLLPAGGWMFPNELQGAPNWCGLKLSIGAVNVHQYTTI